MGYYLTSSFLNNKFLKHHLSADNTLRSEDQSGINPLSSKLDFKISRLDALIAPISEPEMLICKIKIYLQPMNECLLEKRTVGF